LRYNNFCVTHNSDDAARAPWPLHPSRAEEVLVRSGGPGARIVSEIKQAAAVADGRGLVKVGRGAVGAPSHDAGPVIDIGDVVVVGRERVRAAGILASLVLRSGQGVRDYGAVADKVVVQIEIRNVVEILGDVGYEVVRVRVEAATRGCHFGTHRRRTCTKFQTRATGKLAPIAKVILSRFRVVVVCVLVRATKEYAIITNVPEVNSVRVVAAACGAGEQGRQRNR